MATRYSSCIGPDYSIEAKNYVFRFGRPQNVASNPGKCRRMRCRHEAGPLQDWPLFRGRVMDQDRSLEGNRRRGQMGIRAGNRPDRLDVSAGGKAEKATLISTWPLFMPYSYRPLLSQPHPRKYPQASRYFSNFDRRFRLPGNNFKVRSRRSARTGNTYQTFSGTTNATSTSI